MKSMGTRRRVSSVTFLLSAAVFLIVSVMSSAYADSRIKGTSGDDVIEGTVGDDILIGLPGDDTIAAGEGHDRVNAGPGNDILDPGAGDDVVVAGAGDDVVHYDLAANAGCSDIYAGGQGIDTLVFHLSQAEYDEFAAGILAAFGAAGTGDRHVDFRALGFDLGIKEFENAQIQIK